MFGQKEKYNGLYSGLRYLETEFGDLIDLETEPQKFEDLADTKTPKTVILPTVKKTIVPQKPKQSEKNKIPAEFLNKGWDELYRTEKLPEIQKNFPELYTKLRKERFNF